jgi:hypothetical protein
MTQFSEYSATIEGLRQAHCDPLILAIHVEEDALKGLTAEVDWRLAGQLTEWMRSGRFNHDAPILTPANLFLPAGRLLFWRVGSATPQDLFDALTDLGGERPGICPRDFGFDRREVLEVFDGKVIIFEDAAASQATTRQAHYGR